MSPLFDRREVTPSPAGARRGGRAGAAATDEPAKEPLKEGVKPELSAGDRVWGLVTSRYNEEISSALEAGARSCLLAHGASDESVLTFRVPGAFEIPAAARAVIESGKVEAAIGLGVVIRGETPHFDYVCQSVTQGLSRLAFESGRPVTFGILTVDTVEQARERAGGSRGNKGWEAALAALEMAELLDALGDVPRVGFRRLGGGG